MKIISKFFAFLLIGLMLFGTLQEILTPEWNSDGNTQIMISGYRALEDQTIDALFLGTSTVGRSISPMKIYEDTGICSYNLATSGQPIEQRLFHTFNKLQTRLLYCYILENTV